jgi:hypothetical protein
MRTSDRTVALTGTDPEGDPLTFKITTLPADGELYQYVSSTRGALIDTPGTVAAGANHNLGGTAAGLANPWIVSLRPETTGQWTLTLQGTRGSACKLLSSTNLLRWAPLTAITNLGGRILWRDPATNLPNRFYRKRQLP